MRASSGEDGRSASKLWHEELRFSRRCKRTVQHLSLALFPYYRIAVRGRRSPNPPFATKRQEHVACCTLLTEFLSSWLALQDVPLHFLQTLEISKYCHAFATFTWAFCLHALTKPKCYKVHVRSLSVIYSIRRLSRTARRKAVRGERGPAERPQD